MSLEDSINKLNLTLSLICEKLDYIYNIYIERDKSRDSQQISLLERERQESDLVTLSNQTQTLNHRKKEREVITPSAVRNIFEFWVETMGKPKQTRLVAKRERVIRARLLEGYTIEDIKYGILGCKKSAWHMGDNDNGKAYNDLELICRDGVKLEGFISIHAPFVEQERIAAEKDGVIRATIEAKEKELEEWQKQKTTTPETQP